MSNAFTAEEYALIRALTPNELGWAPTKWTRQECHEESYDGACHRVTKYTGRMNDYVSVVISIPEYLKFS